MYKHLYSFTLWPSYLAFVDKNSTAILHGPKAIIPRSPKAFGWDAGIMEAETYVHSW